ncbi:hypothetical protein OH77DRAFT_293805 [Trametes cingulata]|nr:hypothetical protein OH77DRAFT_293805 [Trametes cingulata]
MPSMPFFGNWAKWLCLSALGFLRWVPVFVDAYIGAVLRTPRCTVISCGPNVPHSLTHSSEHFCNGR